MTGNVDLEAVRARMRLLNREERAKRLAKPGNREKARDAQRKSVAKWLTKPGNRERYREMCREGSAKWLEKPGNREKAREASRLANQRRRAAEKVAESAGPSSGDPTSC
jgi:hypothetical protein